MSISDRAIFIVATVFGIVGLFLCATTAPQPSWSWVGEPFQLGTLCLIGAWILTAGLYEKRESERIEPQRIGEGLLRDWRRIAGHSDKLLNVETGLVIHIADLREHVEESIPIDTGLAIVGKRLGVDVVWWGWAQWYKWRWNGTHIDLGPVSVYNLRRLWFWKTVAFLIFPLRLYYDLFRAKR